jgi:hypothetical protein
MKRIWNQTNQGAADDYYRSRLPSLFCREPLRSEGIDLRPQDWVGYGERFDAYVVHRMGSPSLLAYLDILRDTGRRIVWELDDNIWEMPPGLPFTPENEHAYEHLGYLRDWASLIITSTDELARVVGRPDKTVVCPNRTDATVYPPVAPKRLYPQPLKILWAGANLIDAELVADAMRRVIARYRGRVQCYCWQAAPPGLDGFVYVLPSVPFTDWFAKLVAFAPDIVLVPLTDHPFSRCKSQLKYLEMSMAGAAGIYSDLPPYSTVRHRETGLKVPVGGDWFEPLCRLIEDNQLRQNIASRAWYDVRTNHCWQAGCGPWLEAFRRAVA